LGLLQRILIIGAGQAAISCAAKLREINSEFDITVVGEEPSLPYQRPPLSKKHMLGECTLESLELKARDWYATSHIKCLTHSEVVKVDPKNKCIYLQTNETLNYDKLVFATGSSPRLLPPSIGGNLKNVHVLRSQKDAITLKTASENKSNLLIVGGGYIGLEAAAVFTKMGMSVTLVEASERILQRVASEKTSNYFRTLHENHGVNIIEGKSLKQFHGNTKDELTSAQLDDGSTIEADLAIVGIGAIANDQLAQQAQLVCSNGIEVNDFGQTSMDDIYACGDCAKFHLNGNHMRLESVQNAIDQGEHVALEISGQGKPYKPVPWFWSDQYAVKLQIAGINIGHTNSIVRTGKREGSISVWYFKGDKFIAVDAMNDPQAYMVGKKILEAGNSPKVEHIRDSDFNIRELI
jgi:3-phenylpropionate/trans-cinnamate dioxygenase ferredoxin reductase subunit